MCKQRTARRVNVNLGEKEKKSNRPWCAYILGSPYVEDRASIIDEIFTIDYTWYTGDRKNYVFEFLKLTDYPPFHFLSIIIEISLSLSLSSLRKENRIYFCEQVYASRDNMSGSSSCERNRAFYEVRTKHDIIYAKARLETSGLAESRPPSSRFFSPSLRIARYTTTQFSFVSEIRRGENGGDGR